MRMLNKNARLVLIATILSAAPAFLQGMVGGFTAAIRGVRGRVAVETAFNRQIQALKDAGTVQNLTAQDVEQIVVIVRSTPGLKGSEPAVVEQTLRQAITTAQDAARADGLAADREAAVTANSARFEVLQQKADALNAFIAVIKSILRNVNLDNDKAEFPNGVKLQEISDLLLTAQEITERMAGNERDVAAAEVFVNDLKVEKVPEAAADVAEKLVTVVRRTALDDKAIKDVNNWVYQLNQITVYVNKSTVVIDALAETASDDFKSNTLDQVNKRLNEHGLRPVADNVAAAEESIKAFEAEQKAAEGQADVSTVAVEDASDDELDEDQECDRHDTLKALAKIGKYLKHKLNVFGASAVSQDVVVEEQPQDQAPTSAESVVVEQPQGPALVQAPVVEQEEAAEDVVTDLVDTPADRPVSAYEFVRNVWNAIKKQAPLSGLNLHA